MLKGNSELGANVSNYNDFQGHRSSWNDATAVEYSSEFVVNSTNTTARTITLNSDAKTDVQDEDEVQILPYEFDEWYSNDFNTSVPTNETSERTFKAYGSGASNSSNRPTLVYEVASSGFGHKTIGVAAASIGKVNGVATANIGKVIGID